MNNIFNKLFSSPEVQNKLSSKQYELSDVLLDKRYQLNLSFEEIVKIVGLNEDDYIKYEYGDTDISVDNYYTAIEKIGAYEQRNSMFSITISDSITIQNNQITYSSNYENQENNYYTELSIYVEVA